MSNQMVSNLFLKQLSKYYMEFLENDFKASRPPSRRISPEYKNDSSYNVSLNKYGAFANKLHTLLNNNLMNYTLPALHKDFFLDKFSEGEIDLILGAYEDEWENTIKSILNQRGYLTLFGASQIIKEIESAKETEGDSFPHWLRNFELLNFHQELYSLWQNKQMLDQQDIYLYYLSIHYNQNIYPLFYSTVEIEKTEEQTFEFEFQPVLMINQKALTYLAEKYRQEKDKISLPELPPRYIYLSQFKSNGELLNYIQTLLNDWCHYFDMPSINVFDKEEQEVKNALFILKNDFHFALFDKSDEALLNDYEDFLSVIQKGESSETFIAFSQLIHDFLYENPISVDRKVTEEYESQTMDEKFAYYSPIPLNKEQMEALKAIDKKEAKRIIIEGPPGTGKSHTITAVIYDSLLKGKSILMVSDKQEALDVVETKINETLDKMKLDAFVQNPVLRLGKKNSNYNKIFNLMNFSKIKNRYNAYRKEEKRIENEIEDIIGKIKKDIQSEIEASKTISMNEIHDLIQYEPVFEEKWKNRLNLEEFNVIEDLGHLKNAWTNIQDYRKCYSTLIEHYKVHVNEKETFVDMMDNLRKLKEFIRELIAFKKQNDVELFFYQEADSNKTELLQSFVDRYYDLKQPIFGYLFKGKQINQLERELQQNFLLSNVPSLKKEIEKIEKEIRFYQICEKMASERKDLTNDIFHLIRMNALESIVGLIEEMEQWNEEHHEYFSHLPITKQKLNIDLFKVESLLTNPLALCTENEMDNLLNYLQNRLEIGLLSQKLVSSEYNLDRKKLEERLVFKMTNILDDSVIDFLENNRNDATLIRNQFRTKKQISKHLLQKLIKAFPCLIVGIRELGEYIPLEPDLFDLVIIDEASQVSIAQAFPAILRAKKVVVLGDTKQFGNVKSSNASKEINQALFGKVKTSFDVNGNISVMDKLDNFNVKNSILEFMKSIANYHTILKKHFRGYYELIDYSNQYFYDKALEVMKIRSKPISEVIQFHVIPPYEKKEVRKNTNESEAEFIMNKLEKLVEEGYKGTVGIITPFTEQQKWITKLYYESPNYQHYKDNFQLKIMTFDSCQGEERDIIFYSMVEKENENKLNYIFPVRFEGNEEKLKAQRLNVGFSRVKETAVFILSKRVDQYGGEIGKAIRHFHSFLQSKDHSDAFQKIDPNSPMEKKLLEWIMKTDFYQTHRDSIEIIPQFEMGKYLKQIDPMATMPDFRTDFLLLFKEGNRSKTVILEYDGFEYHFQKEANEYTYDYLYTEEDIERQKIIESYGYPFIRMNKFILKENPVQFLDKQFRKHFQPSIKVDTLNEEVLETYKKIENKEIKECQKCGLMKDLKEFYDPSLKTGYGRFCMECKKE